MGERCSLVWLAMVRSPTCWVLNLSSPSGVLSAVLCDCFSPLTISRWVEMCPCRHVQLLVSVLVNMTLFGNRVFTNVIG